MRGYIACAQCEKPITDSQLILDKTNGLAFHLEELDLSKPIPKTGSKCVDEYWNRVRKALVELPTENVRDIKVVEPKISALGRGLSYALYRVGVELDILSEDGATCRFVNEGKEGIIQFLNGGSGRIYMLSDSKDEPKMTPLIGIYNTGDIDDYIKRVVIFTDLPSGKKLRDIPECLTDKLVAEPRR